MRSAVATNPFALLYLIIDLWRKPSKYHFYLY